jgi:hypothetical protein
MQSNTIRFNRLDHVDDIEESIYGSGPFGLMVSRYVFVSCWTKNPEENPDLWQKYANNGKGIRISLDEDMFETHQINENFNAFFQDWFKIIGDCAFILPLNQAKLYDIKYVEDNKERIQEAVKQEGDYTNINHNEIGIYKRKDDWEQQGESRFKLFALPSNYEASENINSKDVNKVLSAVDIFNSLMMSNHKVSTDYVDMPLKKHALDDIEVMMGPKTTSEDKSKVRQILYSCWINRLFSKRKIVDSCLKLRR